MTRLLQSARLPRRLLLGAALLGLCPLAVRASAPLVPTPSWPVNGATVYSTAQALSWYLGARVSGLTFDVRYRLESGAYPGTPQATTLSALRYETSGLMPGQRYRWQVRSCDATLACSAWSSEEAFVVNGGGTGASAPVQPVASWPVGGATVYAAPAWLSWYAPAAPAGTTYHVYWKTCAAASCAAELAAGAPAGNTGYTDSGELAVSRYTVSPAPGAGLVWYVRSKVGGVFSAPSALASFVMHGGPGTVSVVPSWPTGGAEMYTLQPSLSWWVMGGTSGVTGYEVCWGTAPTPAATPMCAAPVGKAPRETFHRIVSLLQWGTAYYWHVRVAGASAWSTASFVTTGAAGTLTPTVAWPTDGAVLYGTEATLSWYVNGASAPIDHFEVELSELGMLGGTTTYFVAGTGRSRAVPGLVPGASYAWRVRSYNGNAYSPWSDPVGTFTVYAPDGAVMPIAESPARGVILPGGVAPVLSWSLPAVAGDVTYEVEVARSADMASAQRFSNVRTPLLVLSSLPAGVHFWRVRSRTRAGVVSGFSPVERFVTMAATGTEDAPTDA
ncbi:MAG TPA: fibronectin type III domain-containing protein, partial [Rhodothermales bacterium]|nr:fibronectin type III domain-containing protein [Rhodothermales bacterium]